MNERRNPIAVKLARVFIVNGECAREEVVDLFNQNQKAAADFMYLQTKVFNTVTRKEGKVIRPKLTRSKQSPFQKLVFDIDSTGAAWQYFTDNIRNKGVLRSRARTVYRNTVVSHVLLRIMDIYDIDYWNRPSLTELYDNNENVPVNTFFPATEIKSFKSIGQLEHKGSVAVGALATPSGVFTTYNLRKSPDENNWKKGTESRFQDYVVKLFRAAEFQYVDKNIYATQNNVLIFGSKEIALAICKGFFSPRSKGVIAIPDTVNKVIFAPDNKSSAEPLTLLSIPDMHKRIRDYVFKNERIFDGSMTEDGILGGYETLLWLDNDLRRLSMSLYKKDRSTKSIQILCLESQSELVEEIAQIYRNEEIEVYLTTIRFEDALEIAKGKE